MRKDRLLVIIAAAMIVSSPASGQELEWAATGLADTTVHVRTLFVRVGGTVFAATNLGLLRTDNLGMEWQVVGPVNVNDFVEISPDILVAVGREGIHRSVDGGANWTQVREKLLRDMCEEFLLQYTFIVQARGGELFTGSIEEDLGSGTFCKINGHTYQSLDQGITWSWRSGAGHPQTGLIIDESRYFFGDSFGQIVALEFTGTAVQAKLIATFGAPVIILRGRAVSSLYAGTGQSRDVGVGAGHGIYRSTDGGETWQQINSGLTDTTITDLVVYGNGTLLASTLYGGVHLSTDHGDSWHPVNAGLPSLRVTALTVTDGGFVFAGTDRGIYRSTRSIATSSEPGGDFPERFTLSQNYPNPFNPQTVIPFEITSPSHVRLAIYDLLGREVAVLVDGFRQAGRHEVSFDAARLPSGVYQYRIETESGRQARSMVLFR